MGGIQKLWLGSSAFLHLREPCAGGGEALCPPPLPPRPRAAPATAPPASPPSFFREPSVSGQAPAWDPQLYRPASALKLLRPWWEGQRHKPWGRCWEDFPEEETPELSRARKVPPEEGVDCRRRRGRECVCTDMDSGGCGLCGTRKCILWLEPHLPQPGSSRPQTPFPGPQPCAIPCGPGLGPEEEE